MKIRRYRERIIFEMTIDHQAYEEHYTAEQAVDLALDVLDRAIHHDERARLLLDALHSPPSAQASALHTYPSEQAARASLRAQGYRQIGGTWHHPGGGRATIERLVRQEEAE